MLKDSSGNIDKLKAIRDAFTLGDDIPVKDMAEILELYPQLFSMLGDADQFSKGLDDAIRQEGQAIVNAAESYIMNSQEIMESSPFAGKMTEDITNFKELLASVGDSPEVKQWASKLTYSLLQATGQFEKIGSDAMGAITKSMFSESNVDLLHRKVIDAAKLTEAGWGEMGEGIATVFTNTFVAGTKEALQAVGGEGENA